MADALSFRALTILGRFPRHLALDEPGTLAGDLVSTLAADLDRQTAQLGRVRTAHRYGAADERRDLLLLVGVHRLGEGQLDLLDRRLAALAGPPAAAWQALPDLLNLPADPWPAWPGEADDAPAAARLAAALAELQAYPARLEQARTLFSAVIADHRNGNGSIGALLAAAAAYLGLALQPLPGTRDGLGHSADGYWHEALARDRLRLLQPQPPVAGVSPPTRVLVPMDDLLALEENPFSPTVLEPEPRHHGDLVTLTRTGFDPVPISVTVAGSGDSTLWPMVVQVDEGHGLMFTGSVPDGSQLVFSAGGRVTLDGVEVGRRCFVFDGGVFADADATHPRDALFAEDGLADDAPLPPCTATFVTTRPLADGFDPDAIFPHAGGAIPPATLAVGETRFRVFVREASFGTLGEGTPPPDRPAVPISDAGIFDASLFADASAGDPVLGLGFSWQEREPFACRLWIPARFRSLDAGDALPVNERLRLLLDRHRAAGIKLSVAYAEDRWTLGEGLLRDLGSTDANGTVIVGTKLWNTVPPANA